MFANAVNGAIVRLHAAARSEEGQTFVEYALVGLLIAVAVFVVLSIFYGMVEANIPSGTPRHGG